MSVSAARRRGWVGGSCALALVLAGALPVHAADAHCSRSCMIRVSVSSQGAQGHADSNLTSISANGRYVAFSSDATNLVPRDTNGVGDVFVRDLSTGLTSREDVSTSGAQADEASSSGSISGNGRYVAFASMADNLVPGDTNRAPDVFVRDRWARTTRRVSVTSSGAQGNGASSSPALSADGRYVVFESWAANLVRGDTNEWTDVFIHDMRSGWTGRISVSTRATTCRGTRRSAPAAGTSCSTRTPTPSSQATPTPRSTCSSATE